MKLARLNKTLFKIVFCSLLIGGITPSYSLAQVLTSMGVAGEMDSKGRNPQLSVRPEVSADNVKILVDAAISDRTLVKFPVRFDFFVNRGFFTSQIRSPELPGPIGIDVPSSIASVPFNYTVIASIVHPNRKFTTLINGAVFSGSLFGNLDCSLTLNSTSEDPIDLSNSSVDSGQSSNNNFTLNFTGTDSDDGSEASISSSFNVNSDDSISGNITVVRDGLTQSFQTSGTISRDSSEGGLEEVDVSSSDGNTVLICD